MPEEPGSRKTHDGEVETEPFSITDALERLNRSLDEHFERVRGVLTTNDLEYLRGNKDISAQGERNRRYEIRKRIINAFKDGPFLTRLQERDRAQVAKKAGGDTLIRTGAFIYNGLQDIGVDPITYWEDVMGEVHNEEVNITYTEKDR